ncbi:hypothetical protein EDB83DRAFT_1843220 [Lactarius deliciosus]|nr:hypothetical protein EDB83DRAFT_1843220 [Lactarius deliciosus]
MYYDDEDDDPYAPRIGPVAMPSPRSRFAPYYSGHANTFEDFLEEFEGRAYDCALTDLQRVDTIIRYVDPSLRELCRTLDGSRSRDWPRLRKSLIDVFGNTTPRHQIMRQKLRSYIQDSARKRMYCEDDVLRYYRQFICFGLPLVHAGHLSEEERDAAFWYGFHPGDREVLRPRLLGKNPLQPPDVPFHFEDVFGCARAAFAYDDYFPSPWSHAKQFEPPSLRREQPVVEPAPRNTYGLRAVTRAIASNAETTTTPDELSLSSHSTPFTQLPPSSSPSVLESQHGLVHSVMLDQPELAHTLSTTLPPSDSTLSHASSFARSVTDSDPLFASTPPSASPTSSTCLPSVTEEQPEPEPEPIPLIAPASTFASTPLSSSSSTFLPTPVISATDCQSESEPASTSESSVSKFGLSPRALPLPPDQKLDLPPRTLSLPPDQTLTPHSSSPLLEISTLGSLPVSLSPDQSFESLSFKSEALGQSSGSCELVSSTLVFAADVVTLSHPELPLSPGEPILFLLSSLDAPLNAPILPRSTPPRLPELKTIGSVSTQLEVTPSPASPTVPPVPRQVTTAQWLLYLDPQLPDWQELSVVYKVSSIKPPALAPRPSLFHSSPSLRLFGTSIRFGFTLALVTTAVLASILNIPATVSTFAHKYWSKQEDIGNNRIGTLNTSSHDVFAQRLRLGQYTPRGTRFVFDPGGQASSSRLFSAHEDFASASRRYATASSRTSPSPFPFQSTIPFLIPEV